ncbi:NAD(P)-dependent oxidoreductase [Niameybacter massiliensis]|uniref:NAD(P)-dependent oxidoreductase n=1 Tax=Holtiella tumoricola TaxID=3018743 RepID=A0AA42J3H7_9FIRM|nr:NAD(P)-dependent oxidoreductase [Holtiella tumoricola]MDA3733983.1 NAD(P)-dependent oxidoreductase [Holtiella tumoricola]
MQMNQDIQQEMNRCLGCKNARCQKHCPISTPIPDIIRLFQAGEIEKAGEILFANNPLSAICAIVCPHEKQCYGNCIKGIKGEPIQFYELERYLSGLYLAKDKWESVPSNGEKVAVVGAGPAGITVACMLAEKGYEVTLFEMNDEIGGMIRYGIPRFRLPSELLEQIQKRLLALNVKIRYNTLIGPVITLDRLVADGYKAIFIGTGVWDPKTLNIKGETLGHVHYAVNYLKSPEAYHLGDKVLVIGAGNVAMDAARTAKRQGAKEVTIVYRKDFSDMPATKVEIKEALEDEVLFATYKAPIEITDEGLIVQATQRVEDEEGRMSVIGVEDSNELIQADSIIIAVSQVPNSNVVSTSKGLEVNKYGLIVTDESGHTTKQGVFASGDVVTGARTVVEAVANAKKVALTMEDYLKQL